MNLLIGDTGFLPTDPVAVDAIPEILVKIRQIYFLLRCSSPSGKDVSPQDIGIKLLIHLTSITI